MFSFLNSTILFAAAAALIPLIIHLFSKRRVKIVEFSSLKHLKQMQRRQVRRLKIRQLLLLLLRMLIILLVVLAFARPTTEGGQMGSHASVSAVILFDNSASMNRYIADGNLFDFARERTGQLLETFGEADEICLIEMAAGQNDQRAQRFSSRAIVAEQLNRLKPGFGRADLQQATSAAVQLMSRAKNLNKEIFIITDRQTNILPEQSADFEGIRVYLVDLPLESSQNIGISSIDFGGQLIIPGHDFDLTTTIRNYGSDHQGDLIASLFIDDNRVGQTAFEVSGSGETTVRFRQSVTSTGFHSGYIEISDDHFMADNRHYFSFNIPQSFNLLVIQGDASGHLLSLAMAPSATDGQYWSLKKATPENLVGVNFRDYDVIFLAGATGLNDIFFRRLEAFVSDGKALFVNYGDKTEVDQFNRGLAHLTGVVIEEGIKRDFSRSGYYSLLSLDIDHPIFSIFNFEDNKPPRIKFYTLPRVRVDAEARTLMRFTGDHPALIEYRFGRGRVLTMTGLLLPEFSDISSHAFFVPFVSRIAEYLASDLSSYDLKLYCGQNVTRALSLKGSINRSLDLITPDSNSFALTPQEQQGTLVLRAAPIDLPGIYRVSYLGREVDRFAVNIEPEECNLGSVDPEQLATSIGANEFNQLGTGGELTTILSELRLGKELWQLLLWLAALVILVEILLSASPKSEQAT